MTITYIKFPAENNEEQEESKEEGDDYFEDDNALEEETSDILEDENYGKSFSKSLLVIIPNNFAKLRVLGIVMGVPTSTKIWHMN